LGLLLLFSGCNSLKRVPDEEYLLRKNKIIEDGKVQNKAQLKSVLILTPNKKVVGIPLRLQMYNLANADIDSTFDRWLEKKPNRQKKLNQLLSEKQTNALKKYVVGFHKWLQNSGEPPAIIDFSAIESSKRRLSQYYKNLGYFNVNVTADTSVFKRKADIKYIIEKQKKFSIDSVTTKIASPKIDSIYNAFKTESYLQEGSAFEIKKFQKERDRLISLFRNNGVFNFQQNSISFTSAIDSTGKDLKIPVTVNINNIQRRINDTLRTFPYEISRIRRVNIFVESNNALEQLNTFTDSLVFEDFHIYSKGPLKYTPKSLVSGIFFEKNQVYSDENRALIYRYFSSLKNFKYPGIAFEPFEGKDRDLEASVFLAPKNRFSLGFDLDFSHSNIQDFGIGFGSVLGIRNVFKGAELLEISFRNTLATTTDIAIQDDRFFNLLELGTNVRLTIPRMVFPFLSDEIIPRKMYPKTEMSFGASSQKNIGLDKQFFTSIYQFNWEPNRNKKLNLKLLDLEFVNNRNVSNYFNVYRNSYDRLNTIALNYDIPSEWKNTNGNLSIPEGANAFMETTLNEQSIIAPENPDFQIVNGIKERERRLTTNNLILGGSFQFNYNSSKSILDEDFYQLRWKAEWIGNSFFAILNLLNNSKNEFGQYEIDGIAPSQYFKTELDYIKHWNTGNNRIVALRFFSGIAIPYGNANSIPFSRSFFSGGANDNRAWQVYRLGPGSSNNINEFNEANFKISFNLEYRFPLIGKLNSALFIDAGNIWNVSNNVKEPKAVFNGIQDLEEIAIGTGFGLRYDFNFLVLRLDTGFKAYNPTLPKNEKWGSELKLSKAVFNIGINYPF